MRSSHASPAKENRNLSSVRNEDTETASVVETARKTLAEEYLLLLKTQNAHWNVEGPNFFSLHKLFEEEYEKLQEFVDRTAEVIRALKSPAPGSFKEFKELGSIREFSAEKMSAENYLEALSQDHTNMSIALKARLEVAEEAEETSCVVLYEDLVSFHDKAAWMIRSHLA
jgi:starvation-inducible DNA-binding protein